MIAEQQATPLEGRLEQGSERRSLRLFVIRLLNFVTNYVIRFVPSFAVRRVWYSRVLGLAFGTHAGVHLGCYFWFYGPGGIRRDGSRIGAYSRINRNCCLDLRGSIRIGENVSISPEVMILTAAHRVDDPAFRVEVKAVVIEDHVFVGTRAMILPGVKLGRGSVVAAGAVVTKEVPALAIVAGVPARQVGTRPERALGYVLDNNLPLFE